MTKYKYLGKKVKDIGKKGLDKVIEYKKIANAIYRDFKKRRISKKVALGRLLLLYRLTFKSKNRKIRNVSNSTLKKLRNYIRKIMKKL
ncbi:MAG: hypothetical protein QXO07_01305 [Candidatus Aenigmatarchaeota archaeon]